MKEQGLEQWDNEDEEMDRKWIKDQEKEERRHEQQGRLF